MARRLDPSKTLIGRMVGWRMHLMDMNYPDYRVNETAKRWFRHARKLGFHVGAHFNTAGVGKNYPELLKRFERGFDVIGIDEEGNKLYHELPGKFRHRYCSTALKDWRQYLISQMQDAVDAGVDLIYIDESMAATGKFVVDGMTAIEGVMTLEKEIMEAYPNVAVETEQFNLMANRHAAFALSQMPPGHPLSGYIFHRFVKVVPESGMYEPTEEGLMDSFDLWGFMLPGASLVVGGDQPGVESWVQIAEAFQKYDLVPDSRLPRKVCRIFRRHPSHGMQAVIDSAPPREGYKFFGYRGDGDVTAYFEKHPGKRGLVVYEPGKEPQWFGTRYTGISKWSGPGAIKDWIIYDGDTMLGLDPEQSYEIDTDLRPAQEAFHVTAIPEDFALYSDPSRYILPIDGGRDGSFYKLTFTGNGQLRMHVPDDMLVFLNGEAVPVDRKTRTATAQAVDTEQGASVLLAFRKLDVELSGRWVDLPWQQPQSQRRFYLGRHRMLDYNPESPTRYMKDINALYTHITAIGVIIGRLPQAGSIHLRGAYEMREESFSAGDGVVRINSKEVMRVPAGERPYNIYCFDVDISDYAGQYVLLEFVCDGHGAPSAADWYNPWIIVER